MRWFVSDLHWGHELVYRKYRSKYASKEDAMQALINQWNKQVKSHDIVYILGDVTFDKWAPTKEFLSKLKGVKRLVIGNHDSRFTAREWIELGFDDVRDTVELKLGDEKVLLSHYPYSSSFKFFFYKFRDKIFKKKNEAKYYKLFLSYKGYKLIHGHSHDGPHYRFDQVNVAWDVNQRLLSEVDIREIFEKNKVSTLRRVWESIKLIIF